jgi:hypothetical protein
MGIFKLCASVLVLATLGLNHADACGWFRAASAPAYPPCYSPPRAACGGSGYDYPPTYFNPNTVPLARPTAAPPSSEPPLLKKVEMPPADKDKPGPTVIELRSGGPSIPGLPRDRCRVGFWNLSGKDVTIVVDGEARLVSRDRATTLRLPREFVWRIGQQPAQSVRVADDKSIHEIVIR